MSEREVYLGDGLYASFDGFQIKLRAPRLTGDHEVYLDVNTYAALGEFVRAIAERQHCVGPHDDDPKH